MKRGRAPRLVRELAERLARVPIARLRDAIDVAEGRAVAMRGVSVEVRGFSVSDRWAKVLRQHAEFEAE